MWISLWKKTLHPIIKKIFFYRDYLKDFAGEALDFLKDIIVIFVIVLVVRTYFIMPFQINGQSMADSYYNREFIIVDRFSYRDVPFFGKTQEIERGDVVVFAPGVSDERKYFIKRIIGLPWETVTIEDGKVYITAPWEQERRELSEIQYLSDENLGDTTVRWDRTSKNYLVPENRYFVLGDNRNHSTDSRTCFQSCSVRTNYIMPSEILWKVLLDLWYFNFSTFSFEHPDLDISTKPQFFSWLSEVSYPNE